MLANEAEGHQQPSITEYFGGQNDAISLWAGPNRIINLFGHYNSYMIFLGGDTRQGVILELSTAGRHGIARDSEGGRGV